jgi:hypothetical protein
MKFELIRSAAMKADNPGKKNGGYLKEASV